MRCATSKASTSAGGHRQERPRHHLDARPAVRVHPGADRRRRQSNVGQIYPNNFGGGQFAYLPPLDAIERIEVVRGPMSTLYGSDAMGGVINIITRRNQDSWHGRASPCSRTTSSAMHAPPTSTSAAR
jgi:hypothetical protein